MTTRTATGRKEAAALERFPDFPPREDMQNWFHLYKTTIAASLHFHFADRPNIDVDCEIPITPSLPITTDVRIPDMCVMIDGDRALMEEQRGYEIAGQGKAPDLALEVASKSTGVVDYTAKRADYERYGVQEYWRYDPSGGEYHDAALAADRLVDGRYYPIEVEWLDADRCRGYSEILELYVCWEYGELRFWDPVSQDYIRTHQDDSERARRAEARADAAERRVQAEARERRAAEARNAELEAELRRLRGK